MGIGINKIRKCKEIAEENHKQSWVPLLKTWIAKEWLSYRVDQPASQKLIAEYAGLNTKQVRESTELLKDAGLIEEKVWYTTIMTKDIDENGIEQEEWVERKKRLGTKTRILDEIGYYEPISWEEIEDISNVIGRQFGT